MKNKIFNGGIYQCARIAQSLQRNIRPLLALGLSLII